MTVGESIRNWVQSGRILDAHGRRVFVHDRGSGVVPTVLLHGFPGSSHDWVGVAPLLPGRVITLDLPGYGFSGKSPEASYSLFDQADVVVSVLEALSVDRCSLVAHDMGDTVAAELATRANAGELGFGIDQVVLTNGSIFIDLARLTRGQRLTLRLPARATPFSLPTAVLRRSLLESFAPSAPPPPGALDDLIAMIRHERGDRLLPKLIRYIEERRVHQEHWTTGLVDFAGPLALVWGSLDPIAVVAMTERMRSLRPDTEIVTWDDVGHWPSIEVPDRLAAEITRILTEDQGH